MTDFSRPSPGTPESQSPTNSAAWIGAVSAATAHYQNQVAGGESSGSKPSKGINPAMVKIKNTTGGPLLRGHAVMLGDYRIDPLNFRKLWFEGETPADPIGKVAIVRRATPNNKQSEAQMLGVTTALVDVTDTDHTHAEVVDGEIVLESTDGGTIEILSPLTSTGVQEVAVLLGAGGSGPSILIGTATASFASTDSTFTIQNLARVFPPGVPVPSAPLTVNNTLALGGDSGQPFFVVENPAGEYEAWSAGELTGGGGGGAELIRFELTEDMDLTQLAATAVIVGTATEINAVDPELKHAGLEGYTDPEYGAQDGYRGHAVRFTADYNETGNPGYFILDMEGQARWIEGTVAADTETAETLGDEVTYMEVERYWGAAPNNRPPVTEEVDGITPPVVPTYDTLNPGTLYSEGQRFRALWDSREQKYVRYGGGSRASVEGAIAIIKGTVPASSGIDVSGTLTEAGSVVTFGTLAADATSDTFAAGALLVNPNGKPVWDSGIVVKDVLNTSLTDFIGQGDGVPIMGTLVTMVDGETELEYFVLPRFELRTEPGFVVGTDPEDDAQGIYHEGGALDQKIGRGECEEPE